MKQPLIFGLTWEQIQAAQQGRPYHATISGPPEKPLATDTDKALLAQHGQAALEANQWYGTLDRLRNSGLIT